MTAAVYQYLELFCRTLVLAVRPPFRWRDFLQQLVFVGWESLPVVLFSVTFAAVVTVIEAAYHMRIVIGDASLVPGFVSMLILRELAAVVTALLLTSRVGAGLAAEVGSMKVTEQIDALKMLAIDPIRYLVVPRFWACLVGGILVTVLSSLVCLYCAMLVSLVKLDYSTGGFVIALRTFVQSKDLFFAAIKGACFGVVIPVTSCYFGFRCRSGAEGVGLATTNSVVATSVMIIMIDFLLSWLFSNFY